MPSKLEKELMAGAADRRTPEQVDTLLAGTIFGKMGNDTVPPQLLKLTSLVASRFQSRGSKDKAHIEVLAESIRTEGLHDPIIVRPVAAPEGCNSITPWFEIVAGHNRVDAYKALGWTEIPAFVRNYSDTEAARTLTTENTHRKGLDDWELYKHMVMLREAGVATTSTELGRLLNVNRVVVTYLDAFGVLPEAAQQLLDAHFNLVGYNLAQKLKPYCPQHALLVFDALVLLAKGKLTQAGVPAWIEEKANPRATKPRKDLELGGGVRLIVTADTARFSGNLDFDALHKLVEENLPRLLKSH
jgi:ParB family chromosome partitioning protein